MLDLQPHCCALSTFLVTPSVSQVVSSVRARYYRAKQRSVYNTCLFSTCAVFEMYLSCGFVLLPKIVAGKGGTCIGVTWFEALCGSDFICTKLRLLHFSTSYVGDCYWPTAFSRIMVTGETWCRSLCSPTLWVYPICRHSFAVQYHAAKVVTGKADVYRHDVFEAFPAPSTLSLGFCISRSGTSWTACCWPDVFSCIMLWGDG